MFRRSVELGMLNLVSYFILTWDLRTVAEANYVYAGLTNLVIALLSFTVLKRISESRGVWDRIAYAVGGTAGTLLGIWTSVLILGR